MKFEKETDLHHKFLENMHDAVLILDQDYRVVDVNHIAKAWYGYSEEEFKKLSLNDIRAPAERQKMADHMRGVLENIGGTWETVHQRKDGRQFPVEVSSTPIQVGDQKRFYHVVRDITARKKGEEALRASEHRYRQIVEFSPDTIFIHRDGKILFVNTAGVKLFGAYNAQQIIGQSLWSLYPSERHEIVARRNEEMTATGKPVPTIEHVMLRLDGSRVNVEATACLIDYEGGPAYFVTVRDITERKKYERDLAFLSKHDPVTGLANRNFFEHTLIYELHLTKNTGKSLGVVFLHVDSFAMFNAAMGHSVGDDLLKAVAARLIGMQLPLDHIGRFGSQFAAIITDVESEKDIYDFIARVNTLMAPEFLIHDQQVSVSFNYGVAMYPGDGESSAPLMRNASIALSQAKSQGRGSVQFCNEELKAIAQKRLKMESALRHAVEQGEFFLEYQPIIDTSNNTVAGLEALIRWQHEGKLVNPGEFIALAERTNLIQSIGKWILRTACFQGKIFRENTQKQIWISVNISPVQFKYGGVVEMLQEILEETKLNPNGLKIEVTESALMENAQKNIQMLQAIKDMGVMISIDDFGTGYSSLNYLRHLPIDFLKIDRSFVMNVNTNSNDAAIVKTIIDLAHNLNYQVIAEGIETGEQLKFLNNMGCHIIQGYYFSRPLDEHAVAPFLQRDKLLP